MKRCRKNLRFSANKSLYLGNGARPRLLLIFNGKFYTCFQLAPKSMTLNAKIGVLWIYRDFGLRLRDTFQQRIVSKSIEIHKDKLHMKFSALNIDFDGPSLAFLGSRKLAHKSIK